MTQRALRRNCNRRTQHGNDDNYDEDDPSNAVAGGSTASQHEASAL